jgi:hypothetical protein
MSKVESVLNKYRIENDVMYDQCTGEVINRKEIKKAYQAELSRVMLESELDLNEIGESLNLRVVNDKRGKTHQVINVKEGFHFVKVFKVALREVLSTNNLSKAAKSAYLDFQAYTSFPNNTVIIDGETPDTEKLCTLLDLKKTRLYDVLKELETAELILRKKINGQLVIYINPFIYNCGLVDQSNFGVI